MSARKFSFLLVIILLLLAGVIIALCLTIFNRNNQRVSISLRIDGYEVDFIEPEKLNNYLNEFGFWEGVVVSTAEFGNDGPQFVIPRSLRVIINDQEYNEDKFSWTGPVYAIGTNASFSENNDFILNIGMNSGFFNGTYNNANSWVNQTLIRALFTRSSISRKESEVSLERYLRELAGEPLIIISETK